MASHFRWEADQIAVKAATLYGTGPIQTDPETTADLLYDWQAAWKRLDTLRQREVKRAVEQAAAQEWEMNRPRRGLRACRKGFQAKADPEKLPDDAKKKTAEKIAIILLAAYWFSMLDTTKRLLIRLLREITGHKPASGTITIDPLTIDYDQAFEPFGRPKYQLIEPHDAPTGTQTATAIRRVLGTEIGTGRARNAARTEATTLTNAGSDAARQALAARGYVKAKRWVSLKLPTTRDDHWKADGQEVEFDDLFTVGDEQCYAPGDPTLSPAQRCNCYCFGVTVTWADEEARQFLQLTKTHSRYKLTRDFNPAEPRDQDGKWQGTGAGSGGGSTEAAPQAASKITMKPEHEAEVNRRVSEYFGEAATHKLAGLVGAPADAEVVAEPSQQSGQGVMVEVVGNGYTMERMIDFGKKRISNLYFEVDPAMQGQGLGTRVLAAQVQAAAEAGFTQIGTVATKGTEGIDKNGYYTFARLGFDGPIPGELKGKLPVEGSRISDLMKTEGGRQAWKAHGTTFQGTFDLTEGSLSRTVLDSYSRAKNGGPIAERDTPATTKQTASGMNEMFNRIEKADGGFTYSPTSDSEPKSGFALSPYPERSFAKDAKDLSVDDVLDYAEKNADMLAKDGHIIGGWHDPASGKVFLDISVVSERAEDAHALAVKHDQIAYYDLQAGKSVTVNPNATSGGTTRPTFDSAKAMIEKTQASPTKENVEDLTKHLQGLSKEERLQVIGHFGFQTKDTSIKRVVAQAQMRSKMKLDWKREARKAGLDPAHVDQAAGDIRTAHNEHTQQVNSLRSAFISTYGAMNDGKVFKLADFVEKDHTTIPKFDEITSALANTYPDFFGGRGENEFNAGTFDDKTNSSDEQKLFDVICAGRQKQMGHEDSYRKALELLYERKQKEGSQGHHEDAVPF